MQSWIGFGTEKESFLRIVKFLKSPLVVFEKDRGSSEQLIDMLTLVFRASLLLNGIYGLLINPSYLDLIAILVIVLLAKIVVGVMLEIEAFIINLIMRLIAKKDNYLSAMQALAYSMIVLIIPSLIFPGYVIAILTILVYVYGFSKKYKISYLRSFLGVVLYVCLIGIIVYIGQLLGIINSLTANSNMFPLI
ncbi:MAG: hypothetical protein WC471_04410 [Candidatus Woesearchaeota archaeon]